MPRRVSSAENGPRYNLLNSACLDLFEFIRRVRPARSRAGVPAKPPMPPSHAQAHPSGEQP